MKDNISPEEKLLRLIRGQKKQRTSPEINIDTDKRPSVSTLDVKTPIRTSKSILIKKYLPILNLQRTIAIAFVISCIYLIISFTYPLLGLRKINLPKVAPGKITPSDIELKQEIKPYEFYLAGIRDRQIFSSPTAQETAGTVSGVNVDLMKDISLVGIISGENPQAVIEDKKTQKTYYVTKGQFIGEFAVEDIREGKIILNYKGQRYELYL